MIEKVIFMQPIDHKNLEVKIGFSKNAYEIPHFEFSFIVESVFEECFHFDKVFVPDIP